MIVYSYAMRRQRVDAEKTLQEKNDKTYFKSTSCLFGLFWKKYTLILQL
jgi:hypothetical protein